MNPELRKAIINGLSARDAWEGIELFRYPPGDLAGRSGFALGFAEGGQDEDVDLTGEAHERSYQLGAALWYQGSGADDDAYEAVETKVRDLLADLMEWLRSVAHGKTLGVDYLELDTWELSFTPEPAAFVEIQFSVREYV
jgi:hypothetical protein